MVSHVIDWQGIFHDSLGNVDAVLATETGGAVEVDMDVVVLSLVSQSRGLSVLMVCSH